MKATDTAPGKRKQKAKMNLPNRLTVLRLIMVPVFIAVMVLPDSVVPALVTGIIGAFLFITAAVTDMLDGKIARKYGLITDFGKLMDPLADKFMVIGALTVIVYRYDMLRPVFIWALLVVVFPAAGGVHIRRRGCSRQYARQNQDGLADCLRQCRHHRADAV